MKQKQVDRNKRFNRFVYKRKKMKTVKEDISEELNHSRREKKSKPTIQNEQNDTSKSLLLSLGFSKSPVNLTSMGLDKFIVSGKRMALHTF